MESKVKKLCEKISALIVLNYSHVSELYSKSISINVTSVTNVYFEINFTSR